jgi:hypothetical protein
MPNRLARCPSAKQWVPQQAWEAYLAYSYDFCIHEREQAAPRRVTLTKSEKRSRLSRE